MPLNRKHILIVEDNDINREMLFDMIADEYHVLVAENGQQALDILEKSWRRISLILLDVHMPVMDGYTFLDRVKADAQLSQIPVIVMTQGNSVADELAALSRGATDFLPKPYQREVILHRIAGLIKLRETSAIVNDLQFDPLTGYYKKEMFCQKVAERLEEEPDEEYCIIGTNIENFKLFNDSMGLQEGDRLLKEIANIASDLLGNGSFCGRFGADRYLYLVKQSQMPRNLEADEQIKLEQRRAIFKHVILRCGVYPITDRSVPVEKMCDRAFLAADRIKGQYGKLYSVYDDSLRRELLREREITDAMESALAKEEFEIYLQPQYSLRGSCMSGAEALVRWNHPKMGFVAPGAFIPLFEKNGFIPKLDLYVWERICAKLAEWKQKGYQPLPISVNISRADVLQGDLPDKISALVEKYQVDPTLLHLEITESAYVANADMIIEAVAELRRRGFVVEMDDFGSGYASFSMFSTMTLDVLKLDMTFVQNELSKPAEKSILDDVIHMAHRAHMSVTAEGVETRAQKNRLLEYGCDYGQGYFFAKPMRIEEYEALLSNQSETHAAQEDHRGDACQSVLLVADEDDAYRKLIRDTFAASYQVAEAANAQEAIAHIDADKQGEIAIVLLSLSLPDKGAVLVVNHLRQRPTFWNTPILATIPSNQCSALMPMAKEADDFLCKGHPLFDVQRRVQRLVDATSFQKRERALMDEACRDPLTDALNRRGFHQAMVDIRRVDMPIALCIFDLDDLKQINDTHGHDVGDRVLRVFAEHLYRYTRAEDVKCRYGGDEFILILKNVESEEIASKKCELIMRAFKAQMQEEGLMTGCSAGITMCRSDAKITDELIKCADQALYCAKRENKGGCCAWEEAEAYSSGGAD